MYRRIVVDVGDLRRQQADSTVLGGVYCLRRAGRGRVRQFDVVDIDDIAVVYIVADREPQRHGVYRATRRQIEAKVLIRTVDEAAVAGRADLANLGESSAIDRSVNDELIVCLSAGYVAPVIEF